MFYLWLILGAVVAIPIAVFAFKRTGVLVKLEPSAQEVALKIENFLEGRGGNWDWDDFISVSIADPELDRVRRRCAEIPDVFPPARGETYCSSQGKAEMRAMVARLKATPSDSNHDAFLQVRIREWQPAKDLQSRDDLPSDQLRQWLRSEMADQTTGVVCIPVHRRPPALGEHHTSPDQIEAALEGIYGAGLGLMVLGVQELPEFFRRWESSEAKLASRKECEDMWQMKAAQSAGLTEAVWSTRPRLYFGHDASWAIEFDWDFLGRA